MRFAARVLLPGTGWIAFTQLMVLVGLMMDLLGKRFLPRGSLALLDFHTISEFMKGPSHLGYRGSPTYTKITNTVSTTTVFGLCTCKWGN